MFLVDSQVHLWLDESPDRPWVKGARERLIKNGHRTDAFTYEECLEHMDKAGVDRVMIVPGSWEGDRIDYALKACEAHPDRFAVMARIPQTHQVIPKFQNYSPPNRKTQVLICLTNSRSNQIRDLPL